MTAHAQTATPARTVTLPLAARTTDEFLAWLRDGIAATDGDSRAELVRAARELAADGVRAGELFGVGAVALEVGDVRDAVLAATLRELGATCSSPNEGAGLLEELRDIARRNATACMRITGAVATAMRWLDSHGARFGALRLGRVVVDVLREMVASSTPASDELQLQLATALRLLAAVQPSDPEPNDRAALLSEAAQRVRMLLGRQPEPTARKVEVARVFEACARVLYDEDVQAVRARAGRPSDEDSGTRLAEAWRCLAEARRLIDAMPDGDARLELLRVRISLTESSLARWTGDGPDSTVVLDGIGRHINKLVEVGAPTESPLEYASVLCSVAGLTRAHGRKADGMRIYEIAESIIRGVLDGDGENTSAARLLIETLAMMGDAIEASDRERSRRCYREAVAQARTLADREPSWPSYGLRLVQLLHRLLELLEGEPQAEVTALEEELLERGWKLLSYVEDRPFIVATLMCRVLEKRAHRARSDGRTGDAVELMFKSVNLRGGMLAKAPCPEQEALLALTQCNLAHLYLEADDVVSAAMECEDALARARALAERCPDSTRAQHDLAMVLAVAGAVAEAQSRAREARRFREEAGALLAARQRWN